MKTVHCCLGIDAIPLFSTPHLIVPHVFKHAPLWLSLCAALSFPTIGLAENVDVNDTNVKELLQTDIRNPKFYKAVGPSDLNDLNGAASTSDNVITVDYTGTSITGEILGAWRNQEGDPTSLSGNKVILKNGTVGYMAGARTMGTGELNNNSSEVSGGTVNSWVFGAAGERPGANLINNTLTLSGGSIGSGYGAYATRGNVIGNTVTIKEGATVRGIIISGNITAGNANIASGNLINMSGGSVLGNLYAAHTGTQSETNNGVTTLIPGAGSNAVENKVKISGGRVNGFVIAGSSTSGNASGNIVEISGGTFGHNIYGGMVSTGTGNAINNTISISGAPVFDAAKTILYGGGTTNLGTSPTTNPLPTGDFRTGNTLELKTTGLSVKGIANFANYNFYIPTTMMAGQTMLTVADTVDLTNGTVRVGINGSTSALKVGERITLLETGGLTSSLNNTRAEGLQNIATIYDFQLNTDEKRLMATALESADSGTDGGNTDGGNTDGSNTGGGNTDGGNTDGGNTGSGNTDGGNTDGSNTGGGNTGSGNTDGGNTGGGNTDGGNTDGGNTDGSNTDGGNTGSGNTGGGNTDGSNTGSGNTGGGNTDGGNTGGGNTGSGNTGGGNTGGGNTDGSNTGSGNTGGGNTSSGSGVLTGRLNPQVKALLEGQVSGLANLGQGQDLLLGSGLSNLLSNAKASNDNKVVSFSAIGGGHSRYKTGSHSDVNSLSLLVGTTWKLPVSGKVTPLIGGFFETGKGSYNTWNSFNNAASIKGSGNTRYEGFGALLRIDVDNAFALDASFKGGRTRTDFHADRLSNLVTGQSARYNQSSTYLGAHAGTTYHWQATEHFSLDAGSRVIWTQQGGANAHIAGDDFKFDTATSLRWKNGARMAYNAQKNLQLYTGLAYDHEFNGKAGGSVVNRRIEAPTLKGGTTVGELGFTVQPSTSQPLNIDLGVQGYTGVRHGYSGNMQVTYLF